MLRESSMTTPTRFCCGTATLRAASVAATRKHEQHECRANREEKNSGSALQVRDRAVRPQRVQRNSAGGEDRQSHRPCGQQHEPALFKHQPLILEQERKQRLEHGKRDCICLWVNGNMKKQWPGSTDARPVLTSRFQPSRTAPPFRIVMRACSSTDAGSDASPPQAIPDVRRCAHRARPPRPASICQNRNRDRPTGPTTGAGCPSPASTTTNPGSLTMPARATSTQTHPNLARALRRRDPPRWSPPSLAQRAAAR